ncbi:MAG: TrbC/VirB2 family protein [Deltaproteobacteria bacterium]|nr:TrbC/VirB2 family protein [Deltaproteobacteria bacterium]
MNTRTSIPWAAPARVALTALYVSAAPALAQNLESRVQNVGNLVINILTVVASVVGVAACIIAGMKYFSGDPHAREQVKGIAIGAFFAFAAAGIVQALKGAIA